MQVAKATGAGLDSAKVTRRENRNKVTTIVVDQNISKVSS